MEAYKIISVGVILGLVVSFALSFSDFVIEYKLWHRYEFCQDYKDYAFTYDFCANLKENILLK